MVPGKRYTVFSIRKKNNGPVIWVRAGVAFVNPDDSMNLYLDVLPLEGQLHIREAAEKRASAPSSRSEQDVKPSTQETDRPESWAAQQTHGGH